jgi:hypothetical protein
MAGGHHSSAAEKHLRYSQIGPGLQNFSASVQKLASDSEHIHKVYQNKWIGIYRGNVEAVADSFDAVTAALAAKRIPGAETLVRFIGQKEMTLIL